MSVKSEGVFIDRLMPGEKHKEKTYVSKFTC